MKITGIYGIYNFISHKWYIGQSINIKDRWSRHIRSLNNGKSSNKLQRAWNKYGEENFNYEILLELPYPRDPYIYDHYEKKFITLYDSFKNGYNLDEGGTGGKILSKETIEKIRKSRIGYSPNFSEEYKNELRERIMKVNENRQPLTSEHKEKLRIGRQNRLERIRLDPILMEEEFKKRSKASSNPRRPLSEEHKRKISEKNKISHKGIKRSKESIAKVAEKHRGMKRSEESKQKMRDAAKNRKKKI